MGAALKVARIVPEEYSPLMARTPRAPTANWAMKTPMRLVAVGSNPAWLCRDVVAQWARVSAVAMAETPRPSTTVMASVQAVERTVRSLVHSERTRSLKW